MAARRPLVIVAGRNKELPVGDTIAWSLLSGVPQYTAAWGEIDPATKADTAAVIRNGGSIPSGADLNNYTTTGFYNQRSNAGAAAGSNYPVSFAGELIVYADGLMVYQTYRRYGAVYAIFHRNYNNGTWYPWVYDWNSSNFDPAGKANVVHGHAISEVSGLQAGLDNALQKNANNTLPAAANDWRIMAGSADGADTLRLRLQSGGAFSELRGAILELNGANAASVAGGWRLLGKPGSQSYFDGGAGSTVNFLNSAYNFTGALKKDGNDVWHTGTFNPNDKIGGGAAFADAFSSPPSYYQLNAGFDANNLLPGQKAIVSTTGNLNLPVVSGIIFWYIECANSYLTGGSQRVQIAHSYSNTPTMCIRNFQGGVWQPWRRLATENDLANIPTQTAGDLLVSKASAIVGVGVSGGRNGGIANYANNGLGDVGVFSEHAGGRVRLRPDGRLSALGEFIAQVGSFGPVADNTQNLAAANARVKEVFAGASAINTSDERHKTPVRKLTAQEIAAAIALADEIGIYQMLEAVAEKGEEEARLHAGMTVQRAIEVMESHGLDAMRYSFICYDAWDELPEIRRYWPFEPRVVDDFGTLVREQVDAGYEVVQEYRAAGDLYSFRMSPLLAFIAAGERAARLKAQADIESRLGAIEQALGQRA